MIIPPAFSTSFLFLCLPLPHRDVILETLQQTLYSHRRLNCSRDLLIEDATGLMMGDGDCILPGNCQVLSWMGVRVGNGFTRDETSTNKASKQTRCWDTVFKIWILQIHIFDLDSYAGVSSLSSFSKELCAFNLTPRGSKSIVATKGKKYTCGKK